MVVGGATATAALASIPDSTGVIHGCYSNNFGLLRVIDNITDTCKSGEVGLNWNQTGPQGPAGPAGPQGPAGPGGSSVGYAVMHITGGLVNGFPETTDISLSNTSHIAAYSLDTVHSVFCVTVDAPQLDGAIFSPSNSGQLEMLSGGVSYSYTVLGRPDFDATVCPVGTNFEFHPFRGGDFNGDLGYFELLFY